MTHDPRRNAPRPTPSADRAPRTSRRRVVVLSVVGLLAVVGLVVGAGVAALYLLNPVADEWHCSQGEAPAGNSCYPEGSVLPPGVTWDPLGNRPLSYNCDQDGWVEVTRDTNGEPDCIREGTAVPPGYGVVDD